VKPKIIYVYSAKGGVGKTTIAVNLAFSLKQLGYSVSLIDADLSGPSVHLMIKNIETKKITINKFVINPGIFGGVKATSTGFITESKDGAYWSGKYLEGAMSQLIYSVDWDTQYVVVDLPPGLGEIHRGLFIRLPGKVLLVTTPHKLSYEDTLRGVYLLKKLNVQLIGLIENMSYLYCKNCNKKTFLHEKVSDKYLELMGTKMIGSLPFDQEISWFSSQGEPFVLTKGGSSTALTFLKIAKLVCKEFDKKVVMKGIN